MDFQKNVLYVTYGLHWGFKATIVGNYERMIVKIPPHYFFQSLWLGIGVGHWGNYPEGGWDYTSNISTLIGRKSAHLEIGFGVLYGYNSRLKNFQPLVREDHLSGSIGFRYQKPNDNFIFRIGIGWPEMVFLSFGFAWYLATKT